MLDVGTGAGDIPVLKANRCTSFTTGSYGYDLMSSLWFRRSDGSLLKGRGALQDIDQMAMIKPIVKWAAQCKTVPQIALNWLLQRPTVATVIIGARNEEQLRQNLAAAGWKLTPEHVARLDAASARIPAYPYWHQRGFAERNPPPV